MPSDKLPEGKNGWPRRQPLVAEREPLTIVVIDTPPAEQAITAPPTATVRLHTRVAVEVPAEALRRRWPVALQIAAAAALLFGTYRIVFQPVLLRFAHGIERRVAGERGYSLPGDPKTRWPQS